MDRATDSAGGVTRTPRRSWTHLAAFVFGVPAALGVLMLLHTLPDDSEVARYVKHPVEWVEMVLFFSALAALVAKALAQVGERVVCRREVLPAWQGEPEPVSAAASLRSKLSRSVRNTFLGRRVMAVLDFVSSRGSATQLDDQMRTLSDNDALTLEGSYALVRFITWAIPILGFLGTVLGITEAIHGVTSDELEIGKVTGGLATAFDATALALGLTMILMFVNFLVERLEQGTLELVDGYIDDELAHRFERGGPESGEFVEALRNNSQVLLQATQQLVERQASVWVKTLEKADRFWTEEAHTHQERIQQALEAALERTLAQHAQRVAEHDRAMHTRNQALVDALSKMSQQVTAQAQSLAQFQAGEAQLLRLQEVLQQNLSTLAGAGAFEQAVQSLTAAIHLLTARAAATTTSRVARPAA